MYQPTQIKKNNQVISNPMEMTELKSRRRLTDRTLHVECPNFKVMNSATARLIAQYRITDAVIGGCGYILVKGPRWQYEFGTKDLNNLARRMYGRRTGIREHPLETIAAGSFYDETKKLWAVPGKFGTARETIKFPTLGAEQANLP